VGNVGTRLKITKNKQVWGSVRETAAELLGKLGDVRAVEPLIELSNDNEADSFVQDCVATALGKPGDARALGELKETEKERAESLREERARKRAELLTHYSEQLGSGRDLMRSLPRVLSSADYMRLSDADEIKIVLGFMEYLCQNFATTPFDYESFTEFEYDLMAFSGILKILKDDFQVIHDLGAEGFIL
jgi:hypothetical protein